MINAQSNYYYYYRAEKVPLTLNKRSLNISVFKNYNKHSLTELNLEKNDLQISNTDIDKQIIGYEKLEYKSTLSDAEFHQKLKALKNTKNIRTVSPNFIAEDGKKLGMSDYFYVKLKGASDFEKLEQLAKEKKVQIVEQNWFMPLWYTLRCTKSTKENTLEISNTFFETGWFASSSPDFLIDDTISSDYLTVSKLDKSQILNFKRDARSSFCSQDPYFNQQWGLYNRDNPSVDINVCQAWEITEGNGVKVAIIDSGIELTHEDLADNIYSLSYDTESNSSPSRVFGSHGTYVSGIIGAVKNNNIQIAGVAPQSTLISISNKLTNTLNTSMKLANGINWAWQHGADIINNSWFLAVQFDAIDDAITNALTKGRNGKGTVMIFPSGDDGTSSLFYPANSNPYIISVGAIKSSGARANISNYGYKLDVVAPGYNIRSLALNNGGTTIYNVESSNTAYISGVAALILSVNSYLTVQQVNDIIEQTAHKNPRGSNQFTYSYTYTNFPNRPNGTWNNEMGYGLVDAYAAVQLAQQLKTQDLYIRDFSDDLGIEPNPITGDAYMSPDIWVRNNSDGIQHNQNPIYYANKPNYVYVRVRNKLASCLTSTGDEKVKLYWNKTKTSSRWPEGWSGNLHRRGVLIGAPIGTQRVPVLQPGEEAILKFTWQAPNPLDYINIISRPWREKWNFTLLARIVSKDDPMKLAEMNLVGVNVINNNNIAMKNVRVIKDLDFYIKDFPDDHGLEPDTIKGKIWRSPGIWIRSNPDGIEQHQNPEYNPTNPNYVYVKVRNRGAISSTGNDQVNLYWRKAGTVSRWPTSWDGSDTEGGTLMSGFVGTVTIPALDSGEETNLFIPWNIPNPRDYIGINSRPWHYCFLARIVSEDDPMTNEQETYTSTNARNNNNIAWKNVTVVEAVTGSKKRKNIRGFNSTRSFGAVVLVGNPFDDVRTFSLELVKEDLETGKAIFNEAEVSLTMDETLYNAWARAGKQSELLEKTYNEKTKRVQGNHAGLNNLRFEPNEMGILDLKFSFLPEELTDKSRFVYHVVQKDAETGEVVGGDTYIINKDSSPLIESSIKEYARVETKKDGSSTSKASLDKIIPNPVSNKVRITYNLDGAKSAYLMVVGFYQLSTKTTNNYDLDTNSKETTLDLKHYSNGYYQIALICQGEIVEVKTLIKD